MALTEKGLFLIIPMQTGLVDVEKVSLYSLIEKNMAKFTEDDLKKDLETKEYEYGFYTDIESETLSHWFK